ncbi:MAG: hypothetical protein RugAbin2_01894 [Rugosibacter sp.]|jgi:site-specific recombinase|nr:hypothetical protein [Rugosibacter sp.]
MQVAYSALCGETFAYFFYPYKSYLALGQTLMSVSALPAIFERPYAQAPEGALRFFVALVDAIRPANAHDELVAAQAWSDLRVWLSAHVAQHPAHRASLRFHVQQLLRGTQHVTLHTDAGILPNSGFFTELWRRVSGRMLPQVPNAEHLKDCFATIFHRPDDHLWLSAGSLEDKLALWDILFGDGQGQLHEQEGRWLLHTHAQLIEAMQVLATRIGAMGLEPELTRVQPRIIEFESPFVHLTAEVLRFTEAWRQHHADPAAPAEDDRHIMVLIGQCYDIIARARRNASNEGTSLSLTYLLVRMAQCLKRLVQLADVLHAREIPADRLTRTSHWLRLIREVVEGENRRHSVREPFRRLTGLLALRVTEHAKTTGEHYITTGRADYFAMWRSAAGGGFIVGFMALIKLLLGKWVFAPLAYMMLYSLNYSLGFVLIHVLHFTLATKQPAMTAATIAESIDRSEGKTQDLHRLADLVVATIRSQLAAIVGNVAVALPVGVLIALAYQMLAGQPTVSLGKAQHMLHDLSPIASLALPHAALTGVLLFFAGLLSGFFDNKAAYDRIPERLAHLGWLRRLIGPQRADRFAAYIGRNLGSLVGNILLGIMLAGLAPLGEFLGLPLDVRHVTLSAANFAFALVALDFHVSWLVLFEALAGLALIGLINLSVSFALALWVALRARSADTHATRGLAGLLWQRLRNQPAQFFVPPRG